MLIPQFTYTTVDCAVVDEARVTSACAALTTKTVLQYASLVVISCSGACGSLVLRLQIDGNVPDAVIAAAEAAIAADPSSVAIALTTTDGSTLNLSPSAVVFQGGAASTAAAGTGKTGKKGTKGEKSKTGKAGRQGGSTGGKRGKGKGKGKGKGSRATSAKQSLAERTAAATAGIQTHLALLAGLLGIVGVAIGLRKSNACTRVDPEAPEPTEKAPLLATQAASQHCAAADAV